MRDRLHRIRAATARRLRRRGTFLLAFGLIFTAYGVALWSAPASPFAGLGQWGALLDTPWWGAGWAGCGILATGTALRRRRDDAAGYNALLIPPLIWALAYTWSAVLYAVTGGMLGAPRAWAAAVIWSAAIVAVLVVSGWPEAPAGEPT